MPRKSSNSNKNQTDFNLDKMLANISGELNKTARKPNIYGYSPHEKQVAFHSSNKKGRQYVGGNRCLAAGTMIQMADGATRAVESIKPGDSVIARDGTVAKVLEIYDNGIREVYRMTVGRYQDVFNIDCTLDHEFDGFQLGHGRLYKPHFGPILELNRLQRSQGTHYGYDEPRALVLGLMLGDGHFGATSSRLQFTCTDSTLLEQIGSIFHSNYGIQYGLNFAKDWFTWFQDLGLIGTRSGTKFIPNIVWEWDERSIEQLVSGYIATDGSVYCNKKGEWHVNLCSKSKEMIEQIKQLMGIRLGIWGSTITYSRNSYSITFGTREAVEKIMMLPIPGIKKLQKPKFIRNSKASEVNIKSKRFLGYLSTYDLLIDHPSHIFMLANGAYCANSGKTTSGVAEDIFWLTNTHPYLQTPEPPVIGRICTVDFKNGVDKIILPNLRQWLPPSYLKNGSWEDSYHSAKHLLTLENGSELEIMSYEQDLDKFAGVPRHFCHMDEEPPKNIFGENKARLVDYRGKYWITMTPVDGMTWTYDEIYEPGINGDPLIDVIVADMTDNPHIDHEEIIDFLSGLDAEERIIRGKGEYIAIGGLVFKYFNSESHVTEPLNLRELNGWTIYESLDHGFSNPTAWLWHAVHSNGIVITFDEHYKSEMTVEQHAYVVLAKEQMLREQYGFTPYLRIADPAIKQRSAVTGYSIQIEYSLKGLDLALGQLRNVDAGLNRMNTYLRNNKWFITSNCTNLLKEMRKYKRRTYMSAKLTERNNRQEEPMKKDDHAIDSCRYFFSYMPELSPLKPGETPSLTKESVAKLMGASTVFNPAYPIQFDYGTRNTSDQQHYVADEYVGEW